MQKLVKISFVVLLLSSCSSTKKTDTDYFEQLYYSLTDYVATFDFDHYRLFNNLEDRVNKNKNLNIFLENAQKSAERIDYYMKHIHFLENKLMKFLEKDTNHKYHHTLKLLSDRQDADAKLYYFLDSLTKNHPKLMSQKMKVWYQQGKDMFDKQLRGLPLYGGLVKLTQMRYELVKVKRRLINKMIQKAESIETYPYLQFHLSEENNKVKLGEDYQASLRVLKKDNHKDLRMKINGEDIPIKNGVGKLRVKAQGLGKKRYKGEISFYDKYYEKDTTLRIEDVIYEVIPKK